MVQKLFMKQIPHAMRNAILEDHLHIELNTLDKLVLSRKAWKDTEQSKREYARKDTPTLQKHNDCLSGLKDPVRASSGMRIFLCQKGNNCNRNIQREHEQSRIWFSPNIDDGRRDTTPNAPPPPTPACMGNTKQGHNRPPGDTSHLTYYTCGKRYI